MRLPTRPGSFSLRDGGAREIVGGWTSKSRSSRGRVWEFEDMQAIFGVEQWRAMRAFAGRTADGDEENKKTEEGKGRVVSIPPMPPESE